MTNIDKNISNESYQPFLSEIVNLVQHHRLQAVQAVQSISNQLYWSIGELIIQKQQEYGWGKSIVEKLSTDLNIQIGEGISWSPRNLWFMRQLVSEYSILNQPDSELEKVNQAGSEIELVQQLVAQIPWGHNILIVSKSSDINEARFYIQKNHRELWMVVF